INPRKKPTLIDATAGWGRDSFILASLGFQVTMLERSPIVYALLKDGLRRAREDVMILNVIDRLTLINTDAINWMTSHQATIVYLDPMFPPRQKAASVKKEMVILQDLLGKDEDAERLFEAALACANERIVVKRPKLAGNIVKRAPNF